MCRNMKYRPSACHITAKVIRNQIHFGMEHTDRRKISHRALSLFQPITLFIKCATISCVRRPVVWGKASKRQIMTQFYIVSRLRMRETLLQLRLHTSRESVQARKKLSIVSFSIRHQFPTLVRPTFPVLTFENPVDP
jgi:hypothetical protein